MTKFGKFISMVIVALLVLSVMSITPSLAEGNFNETGFPIVNETVTKKIMIRKPPHIGNPEEMPTLKEYEKLTNVKIEWDAVSADGFNERVNLVMASNTLPDAIIKGVPNIIKASEDGSIIALNELIDKYGTGIKALFEADASIKTAATSPDGNIYAVPGVNTLVPNRTGHRNLWINKDWLTKLGLESPKTMDEFITVLRAFRDNDPNGDGIANEIPMVYEGINNSPTRHLIGSFGIVPNLGYGYLAIDDGKVSNWMVQDRAKELLQILNMMWTEKLIDNENYTQPLDINLSKFNSSVSGVFGLSSDDLWSQYSASYQPLVPPSVEGYTQVIPLSPAYGGAAAVITKADQSPEITLRWLDYFFTEEGSMLIGCFAPALEGVSCQRLPDGGYDYSEAMLTDTRGISVAVGENCPLPGGGFPYWRNPKNSNYIFSKTVQNAVPIYEPFYQKTTAYAYPVFSVADAETINDIRKDLDVYIAECEAKFITGEMSFDKWAEYVSTCESMGLRDLEALFQTAYDSMSK